MTPASAKKKDKQKNKASVPIVDSLATALRILDFFTIREPELSLRELSEKSRLYKSRIHRLCGTLVALGFLTRMPSSSYRLGPKLMTLGKIYENTNTLVTISRSIMKQLAVVTGESVALFQLDGETSFCLAREYGSSRLVFSIMEGDNMDLHASAAGRILMTYGPEELSDKILSLPKLEKFTSETITNPKKLAAELSAIKQRGYAINRGERELEVAAIAAPIFNYESKVESTLAIVGPVQRFTKDREDEIVQNLLEATRKISELLGAPQQ
ncbi:MAG: IclR family transcriptional regulator [Desulfobacterales bacterium]|nr:IclR family transcriptional regulator [Desulfobacterales bacterium]